MIAFGCSITEPDVYLRCAEPGIRLAAEPDTEVLPQQAAAGSIFRNYNLLCDRVADRDDLEALVLLHQDAEIVDPGFCDKVREALSDPEVAIVGCAGAIGVRSIAWWEGSVTWAGFAHRFDELGGGEIPALTWDPDDIPPWAETGEVDTVDGFVMVLSPWAVRELRFDESLGYLHGYDFDICMQAHAAGRKVVTADFRALHHHSLDLVRGTDGWIEAHIRVAEKWEDLLSRNGRPGSGWRWRALRAEAESSARLMRVYALMHRREAEVTVLKDELEGIKGSASWRLTAPLRRAKRLLRGRSGS
jgi:GT2 family glycosyltransferase